MAHQGRPTADPYPHRVTGLVLLGVGLIALAAALIAGAYSTCSSYVCSGPEACSTPAAECGPAFAAVAVFLGLIAFIFMIVGLVLAVYRDPSTLPPPVTNLVPVAAPPMVPVATMIACKGCGRVYPIGHYAFCPACGTKLGP